MKSKAVFMALLALVFQVQARPVIESEAATAARAWAYRGETLGARMGTSVDAVTSQQTQKGVTFFAVRMKNGGTVFTSSDTEDEPILAFTPSTASFEKLDKAGPLFALLNRRLASGGASPRLRAASGRLGVASSSSTAATVSAQPAAAEARWAELLELGRALETRSPSLLKTHVINPQDVRAGPLLRSRWSQSYSRDYYQCFNLFTPELSSGDHAVCGCVATAIAQLMRYHKFPVDEVTPVTRTCTVEAAARGNPAAKTELTMEGGIYDWDNMPLDTDDDKIGEEHCETIGRLLSDVGISVGMNYDEESGAFAFNIANALTNVFGYASAEFYQAKSGNVTDNETTMRKAMLSNFDAGYPVLMSISREGGGHQIVGDGYGFSDKKLYVHLNMGWANEDDVWYNLPDIDASIHYTSFEDVVFNIFPTEATESLVTGRVTDDDGHALSNVVVCAYAAGVQAGDPVQTDENGVYALKLPAGQYDLVAGPTDELPEQELEGVKADKTESVLQDFRGLIVDGWIETYKDCPSVKAVGNSWGNDMVLMKPSVRIIVSPETTNVYSRLDKALAAAKALSATMPVVPVELLLPAELREPFTIDFACSITATNDDPHASAILRDSDAAVITVATNGTLALSHVAFERGASATAVVVKKDGCLKLSGTVDFGLPMSVAAVRTYGDDGLVLADAITEGFALECTVATRVDDVFGLALCDFETASNSVAKIENFVDGDGEIRGIVADDGAGGVLLKWGEAPVPFEDAAGYFVDANDVTNTAARLDRLIENYERALAAGGLGAAREIVINDRMGLRLTRPMEIREDLTIRSEGGATVDDIAGTAGFTLRGGRLTVENVTFSGYKGNGLFVVNSNCNDHCELVLDADVAFSDIEGTNYHSGAVAVLKGRAKISGTTFTNCRASGLYDARRPSTAIKNAMGGAIYLKGAGCELELDGGTITGCSARVCGGGIYVGKGARLDISGNLTVKDNLAPVQDQGPDSQTLADDIYLPVNGGGFNLAGALSGVADAVGVRYGGASETGWGNAEGDWFVTVADETDLARSINSLFSDYDPKGLEGEHDAEQGRLRWRVPPTDRRVAVADGVVYVDGDASVAGYYAMVEHAFEALTNGTSAVTVELLSDAPFASDLTVTRPVKLFSSTDPVLTLTNEGETSRILVIGAAAKLTLEDITVNGGSGRSGLIDVDAGSITLSAGATVEGVQGASDRAAGAISVWHGGLFTMEDGAKIRDCRNSYWNAGTRNGYGGGLLLDASTARFTGGEISGCQAGSAGGAFICNGSVIYVKGNTVIDGNFDLEGNPDDLRVSDDSELWVDGVLTGSIGYTEGALSSESDPNVFGYARFSGGSDAEFADSARCFRHDTVRNCDHRVGDIGQAMRNGSSSVIRLVWGSAIAADGTYGSYTIIDAGTPAQIAVPTAADLVYNGEEQTGVETGAGYEITGNRATAAGTYTATAVLKQGFAWAPDGNREDKDLTWTIAKKVCDISGLSLTNCVYDYDGEVKSLEVSGGIPEGVEVRYTGNGRKDPGDYQVTATFALTDTDNYTLIPEGVKLTATLTIREPQVDPGPIPPPPEPTPVPCEPFAVTAIEQQNDGTSWLLTIDNAKKYCSYTLWTSTDLENWDERETKPCENDGDLQFIGASEGQDARFWKVIGHDGVKPAENED